MWFCEEIKTIELHVPFHWSLGLPSQQHILRSFKQLEIWRPSSSQPTATSQLLLKLRAQTSSAVVLRVYGEMVLARTQLTHLLVQVHFILFSECEFHGKLVYVLSSRRLEEVENLELVWIHEIISLALTTTGTSRPKIESWTTFLGQRILSFNMEHLTSNYNARHSFPVFKL